MTHQSQLEKIAAEYAAARDSQQSAVWTRPAQGLLRVTGADRTAFLQGMISQDVLTLKPSETRRAALLDSTGHILADLRVHARSDSFLLEMDLERISLVQKTLNKYIIMEAVSLTNVSAEWSVQRVYGTLPTLPNASFTAPVPTGTDVWLPVGAVLSVPNAVSISEITAEIIRVEDGDPVWGRELSEATLLPETELTDAVSYTKGCYVGQEIVARLDARGHVNRALRGILLDEDAPVPSHGATLHVPESQADAGREIGRITSAVSSVRFEGRPLALGYVRKEYNTTGTPIAVRIQQPGGAAFEFRGTVLEKPFL